MFQNLTGWHALIILAAVLLLFGAAKLPALARSVGQSVRILKSESKSPDAGPVPSDTADPTAPSPLTPAPRETGEPVATTARVAS